MSKFTGKHVCQSLFFNKVAGLRHATLLKKKLWHRSCSVNFAKLLRTPFLQNTSGRLLLYFVEHLRTAATVSHPATSAYAKHSKFRIWFYEKLFKCILASTSVCNFSLKIFTKISIHLLPLRRVFLNLLVSLLYYFLITIFSLKLFLKKIIKANY